MVHLKLRHQGGKGFDLFVWAAFLGLLLFWAAVGITVSRLF